MQSQTGAVRIRLVDAVGKTVAATSSPVTLQGKDSLRIRRLLAVKQIHLWSVEEPYLYRLEVELLVGGKRMDASSITCGIRTYRFDPNQGFLLNGVRVQLKGTNNHHDGGPLGSACLDQTFERQLKLLKGMGCNALRMSHNPPAPELLDAADRLGFVVIDECFDEWMNGKTAAGYASYFKDWFSKDVESWIKRDRNHPSVVAWSIGNEVKEQWDPVEGPRLARLLKDEVLKFDSTRPITSGCNGIKGINASGMAQILDLVGYNYEESMYEKDHKQYPQRVILGTETLQYPYHPGPCDQFRSYDQWLAAQRNAYVAGEFIWTGFDYLGEAGIGEVGSECEFWKIWPGWPTFGATCGLLDLCGFPNTGYWFRRALWRPEPMVYLAVETDKSAIQRDKCSFWAWPKVEHHWNHPKTGDTLVVHVYTNVADVSLKLNGRSLGTKHWDPSNEAFLVWQVPYEPGALEAMGTLPNGKQVGDKVVTAGAPYRIKLVPERESIKANRQDLCYVQVYLLDRNDQPVPFADQTIQFEVSGAGKIRAVGNGNLHAYLPYQATQTKSYEGRCLVILQSGEESGLLTIKAKGENLLSDAVAIRVLK
ncbi:MAG: DUF4982 domain-containing protein, partial [Marinilabiliales bacterium]|nr:DUF4982 domain-containing protein [Marinilabiliales bacterium]